MAVRVGSLALDAVYHPGTLAPICASNIWTIYGKNSVTGHSPREYEEGHAVMLN